MTSPKTARLAEPSRARRYALDLRFSSPSLRGLYPGVARYTDGLFDGFREVALDEELIAIVAGEGGGPSHACTQEGAARAGRRTSLQKVALRTRPRSLSEQWRLAALAARGEVALFHSPFWWTSLFLSCPLVLTIYDAIPELDRDFLPDPYRRLLYRVAVRAAARRARRVITLTEAARDQIVERLAIDPRKVVTTPAAPGRVFRPPAGPLVADTLSRLGVPERYLLVVGADRPHKNLGRLLEAFSQLAVDQPGLALVVAGHPSRRRELESATSERVLQLGAVPEENLPALYSGARYLVLPSLAEGLGFAALEAMACGTAVTCSRIPALVESVGDAGLFFDPRDVESIYETLRRAVDDDELRQELVARGEARVAKLSWQQTAERTLEVYRAATEQTATKKAAATQAGSGPSRRSGDDDAAQRKSS